MVGNLIARRIMVYIVFIFLHNLYLATMLRMQTIGYTVNV